jgi:hypothetical protein
MRGRHLFNNQSELVGRSAIVRRAEQPMRNLKSLAERRLGSQNCLADYISKFSQCQRYLMYIKQKVCKNQFFWPEQGVFNFSFNFAASQTLDIT